MGEHCHNFSAITFILPYILNIPSNPRNISSLIPGIVVLTLGTMIILIGILNVGTRMNSIFVSLSKHVFDSSVGF
jgi:hypothetical protein